MLNRWISIVKYRTKFVENLGLQYCELTGYLSGVIITVKKASSGKLYAFVSGILKHGYLLNNGSMTETIYLL